MKYIIFFLLYSIGECISIQLVGTLSVSDLCVALYFLFLLFQGKVKKIVICDKDLIFVTRIYIVLLLLQFFSEVLVDNSLENMAKGLAVTILSYMKLIFLWNIVSKRPKCILWMFLFMSLAALVFMDSSGDVSVSDILSGEQYSFFKFKIAPLIGQLLVVLTLIRGSRKNAYLFIFAGALCAILGARSTGLMIFFTGFIPFFLMRRKQITKKQLFAFFTIGGAVCYGLFVLYVSAVLSGSIKGGNSDFQFKQIKNPYNPIYALLSGRSESPASLTAIADSPWTGWGAWAQDSGWKYHKILMMFQGEKFDINRTGINIIPAHSVILQTGVHNGIFAMLAMAILLCFFVKIGWKSLDKFNPYYYLIVFCIMQLIWNGLFSPLSHFRGHFPIYFVCCLYSYKYTMAMRLSQRLKTNSDEAKYL